MEVFDAHYHLRMLDTAEPDILDKNREDPRDKKSNSSQVTEGKEGKLLGN